MPKTEWTTGAVEWGIFRYVV